MLLQLPVGRDAVMVAERLGAAGIASEICDGPGPLLAGIASGAGAVVVAQEALGGAAAADLLGALEAQEPWSDVPVVLLTHTALTTLARARVLATLFERANVTMLQRPLDAEQLVSALRAAVRARRRQYQMRDLHRELERSVELSDLFVSILGHDLRNPLGAITLGVATILELAGEGDRRVLRAAGRIASSANRMARMIEQLLDYARVRQGAGIPVHPQPGDLARIAVPVVEEIEDANPDARLSLESAGDLSGSWDPDRLEQLASNLVGNAVQHGTPGEPVSLTLDGTDPRLVRLCVHNEGAVPEKAMPLLFEGFRPANDGDGRPRGLGLGLFIARAIARAHGGDIVVSSSAAAGTTFEVTLPRRL